jgi:hypothetical protein
VYVRALLAHWPGLEFAYPRDFQPSAAFGSSPTTATQPATYLIGEALVENLAAGADRIVKFVWQQALVPPASVTVGTLQVTWHPCLLLEISPHDGPWVAAAGAVPVEDDNNLAQRNVAIVDLAAPMKKEWHGMMMGSGKGVGRLILDAERLSGAPRVRLKLSEGRLAGASGGTLDVPSLRGTVTIDCPLERGQYALLCVSIEGAAEGTLRITQLRADGVKSPGFAITLTRGRR